MHMDMDMDIHIYMHATRDTPQSPPRVVSPSPTPVKVTLTVRSPHKQKERRFSSPPRLNPHRPAQPGISAAYIHPIAISFILIISQMKPNTALICSQAEGL